jgi:hypothetical protein
MVNKIEGRSLNPGLGKLWEFEWSPFDLLGFGDVLATNQTTIFWTELSVIKILDLCLLFR